MKTISSQRLYQAAWTIASIYLAILVAEIVQNSLVPLLLDPDSNQTLWWIAIPTLALNLLSAFEAYLWLSPVKDLQVSIAEARFKGVLLAVYLLAIVSQMLLLEACTEETMPIVTALSVWAGGMTAITGIYFVYNAISLAWPHDADNARKREYKGALLLYGSFAAVFAALAAANSHFDQRATLYGALLATVAGGYFVVYCLFWRAWYLTALSSEGPRNLHAL
jgi:hypothetical protein